MTAEQTSSPHVESLPAGYAELLEGIKAQVRAAQVRAALSVNRELIALYWEIGRSIVERQDTEGWGKSVVDRLARDLKAEFPAISGFSSSNVWRMRSFYLAWPSANLAQAVREMERDGLPQAVAEIP
jgi:hypothetical protein